MKHYKFIAPFLSKVKWLLFLSIFLSIVESLSFMAITGLQQYLIDDILLDGKYEQTLEIIILFAIAFFMYALLFTFTPHTRHKVVALIQKRLSHQFVTYMYKIPINKLQKERTGSFVHYITDDISNVSHLVGEEIPLVIKQLVTTLILMVIVGTLSPIILLFCSLICIGLILVGKYFSYQIKKAAKEVQEMKSRLLVQMEEGISSTREIIGYHRLKWEEELYQTYFQNYYDKSLKAEKINSLNIICSEPFNWGIRLLILGYGGYLVLQNQISIGTFIVVFQFGSQLAQSIQDLHKYSTKMWGSYASVERVRNVMEGEYWDEGTKVFQQPIKEIKFERVTFKYESSQNNVLDDLSINFPIGRKIAIVGMSGGGKSTIAQLLIRFFDPTTGEIIVNGKPLNEWKRNEWISRFGIVFQEPYLFPDTILNNLLLGLNNVSENKIRRACQAVQIDDYIMTLPNKYNTVIGDRGITLSGGQRQRLAIARAIIREPEILIFDEATSALDQVTEKLLQKSIDLLRKDKTTIIVAHRLSTVQNADIIYVMDKGKVIEYGNHEELMINSNVYKKLVYTQQLDEQILIDNKMEVE